MKREAVEVEEEHGAVAVVAVRLAERVFEQAVEERPVGQAGQRVVVGQPVDLALGFLAFGDVRKDDEVVARPPLGVLHRTDRRPARKGLAVAALELQFAAPLAGAFDLVADFRARQGVDALREEAVG